MVKALAKLTDVGDKWANHSPLECKCMINDDSLQNYLEMIANYE